MTRSRVACSLALAAFGLGASAASAQNVTAFNPYDNTGRGVPPSADVRGYGVVDVPPPMSGPAFNPWRPAQSGGGPGWVPAAPMAQGPARAPAYSNYGAGPSYGSGLPPPPPDALQSRIVAIPERGDGPGARRMPIPLTPSPMPAPAPLPETPASTVTVAPPPAAPAPVPVTRAEPVPPPAPAPSVATTAPPPPAPSPPPVTATPTPSPPPVAAVTPAPPPVVAAPEPPPDPKAARPAPNEQRAAPPSSVAPAVSVLFATNSAEISDLGKSDLDRVAKTISQQRMAAVELRAFAGGTDPTDARKVALARALAVRSYLIDQGVKARIEVGAFAAAAAPAPANASTSWPRPVTAPPSRLIA